ncbi:endonuclease 8-like 1 isoform X2 [Pelobates fuscus]
MPECPELHLASVYINARCAGRRFTGAVEKSEVNKNAEVPFSCPEYTISAVSRGKELKVILTPLSGRHHVTHIVFRFGMSGSITMKNVNEMPKHAHLRFYTKDVPRQVLCFVDPRRFGSWHVNGSWQPERGPCVIQEYEQFRENVLKNLSDKVFDKPICEALLNQKYFNGIGNYLRSEILFRSQTPPFMQARPVLEAVKHMDESNDLPLRKKVKIKKESPDILELCSLLPKEVVNLGGKGYEPGQSNDYSILLNWARCYFVPGMKSLKDHNGRTVWFQGDPGPLAPKGTKGGKPLKRKKVKKTKSKARAVKKEENDEQIESKVVKSSARKRVMKSIKVEEEDGIKIEKPHRTKRTSQGVGNKKTSRRGSAPKTSSQPQNIKATVQTSKVPRAVKAKTPQRKTAIPTRESSRIRTLRKSGGRAAESTTD